MTPGTGAAIGHGAGAPIQPSLPAAALSSPLATNPATGYRVTLTTIKRNKHGAGFVVADTLEDLITGINKLTDQPLLDPAAVRAQIEGATAAPRGAGRASPRNSLFGRCG